MSAERSRICHKKARSEVFTCKNFRERVVVGLYYKSLASGNLGKKLQMTKSLEEEYMKLTADSFPRWTFQLSETATDNKEHRHHLWEDPAPFSAVPYINGPRYLPGDEESRERRK